jgi:hypothetical protein
VAIGERLKIIMEKFNSWLCGLLSIHGIIDGSTLQNL